MQTLLEKIEADAAARLRCRRGASPPQELARYQAFLKVETHRLKMLHRGGAGGREDCRTRAAVLDVLLRYLWDAAKASALAPGAKGISAAGARGASAATAAPS